MSMCRILGPGGNTLKCSGRVGFDSLPDQVVNKAIAKGFDFNILCVGETGIGKSTLMDTIFKTELIDTQHSTPLKEVTLDEHTYHLKESQVKLQLTIIDTVGYGDQVERGDSAQPVVDYIEKQFDNFLQQELRIQRNMHGFRDPRVHVCIYFISPTGHALKSLDIACMKALQTRVNIIPVISKADTIARNEMSRFKQRILQDMKQNDIEIYRFPTDDNAVADINSRMNDILPFAVIGSRDETEINGQKVRARLYPWGTVEVENETHCDFIQLREMLIRINMEDLRETTHNLHYAMFRRAALEEMGFGTGDEVSGKPVRLSELLQTKSEAHIKGLKAAEEKMKQRFIEKVSTVEAQLRKEEKEMQDNIDAMKRTVSKQKAQVEEDKLSLEEEIANFRKHRAHVQERQAQVAKEVQGHSIEKKKR